MAKLEGTVDHITEDDLDRYAAASVLGEKAALIEEHLLVCEVCQDRLQLTDEFIAALRDTVEGRKGPSTADQGRHRSAAG
jgi:hypothetical protein